MLGLVLIGATLGICKFHTTLRDGGCRKDGTITKVKFPGCPPSYGDPHGIWPQYGKTRFFKDSDDPGPSADKAML